MLMATILVHSIFILVFLIGLLSAVPSKDAQCEMIYEKLIKSVSPAIKEEIQFLKDEYYNWGKLLAPAPVAIGILGQLILMVNQKMDFPINSGDPQKIYKHIQYPNSFRTTLLQISQRGYRAFLKAHINMEAIRNLNRAVPGDIKDAVRYLISGNVKVIKLRLPATIKKIKEAAKRSQDLSKEVVNEFTLTLSLIEETEKEMTSKKSYEESRLKDVFLDIKLEKQANESSEKEHLLLQQKDATMKKVMQILKLTMSDSSLKKFFISKSGIIFSNPCAEKNRQQLLDLLIAFGQYRERYEHWQTSNNQKNSVFNGTKTISEFERVLRSIQQCSDVGIILIKGTDLIKKMKSPGTFQPKNKTTERPCSKEIDEIVILVENLRKSANDVALEVRIETKNIVSIFRSLFGKSEADSLNIISQKIEDMIKLNNLMTNIRRIKTQQIVDRITSLDITKVNINEVIYALKLGLVQLGELKKDWGELIRFFGNLHNFIITASSKTNGLVEIVHTLSKDPEVIFEEPILFDDLLKNVEKSNEAVLLVHEIADMYTKVSDRYIMGRVARLNTMNSMMTDGVTDQQLQQEKEKLSNDTMQAYEEIEKYFNQSSKQLNEKLKTRHQKIMAEYDNDRFSNCHEENRTIDRAINFTGDYWFQLKSRMNGKVLEVSSRNNSVVRMWDSHGKDNQLWYLDQDKIIRSFVTDGCLTSHDNPKKINIEPCKYTKKQKWTLKNNSIVNVENPTRCLHVHESAGKHNGTRLVECKCYRGVYQLWNMKY